MKPQILSDYKVTEATHFYLSENINSIVREWVEHIFLSAWSAS